MLGDRIRALRNIKGITLKELGNVLNVGESTVSMYENNKRTPDYETLKKIADFFEVSVDYLLGRTDKRNPSSISDDDWPPEAKVLFRDVKKLTPEQLDLVKKLVKEFINED